MIARIGSFIDRLLAALAIGLLFAFSVAGCGWADRKPEEKAKIAEDVQRSAETIRDVGRAYPTPLTPFIEIGATLVTLFAGGMAKRYRDQVTVEKAAKEKARMTSQAVVQGLEEACHEVDDLAAKASTETEKEFARQRRSALDRTKKKIAKTSRMLQVSPEVEALAVEAEKKVNGKT